MHIVFFSVVGCRDLEGIGGVRLTREGNRTTAICEHGDEQTVYKCNGSHWQGHPPNCTTIIPANEQELEIRQGRFHII